MEIHVLISKQDQVVFLDSFSKIQDSHMPINNFTYCKVKVKSEMLAAFHSICSYSNDSILY